MKINHMKCLSCSEIFSESLDRYVCDSCGIDGILEPVYDYDSAKVTQEEIASSNDYSLWRYKKLMPLPENFYRPPLHVGWTPMYCCENLASEYQVKKVFIKDDGRNPTASLKDRASAIGISKAVQAGAKTICAASTGNAASSIAGFAASAGIKSLIFVPAKAPRAKISQLLVYGADTMLIDAAYDKVFELSVEISKQFNIYNRNCAYNPYLVEGKKTVAYEIWEQAGFQVVDKVFVSLGDGCITSSIYKGFYDLKMLGLIEKIPQVIAVQAEGCNPVEKALQTGSFEPQNPNTIADSIAVGVPRNRLKAINAIKSSHGQCVSVSDEQIKQAILELPGKTGVFGEPAGVTAFAGFKRMATQGSIKADEQVAIVITGNGLKDIDTAISACQMPQPLPPDIKQLNKIISDKTSY